MSNLGSQMDALIVIAQTAIPTIVAERGVRLVADLRAEEFPHLFVFDPSETVELLDHNQERVEARHTLVFAVRGETQESLLSKLDTFRDDLRLDPTLGGIVDYAYLAERGVNEHPDNNEKEAAVVVVTLRERF